MTSLDNMEEVFVKSEPTWDGEDASGVSVATARVHANCVKDHEVKDEKIWESEADACGVSEAAVQAGLYKHHEVKDELVLGPEILQPPDVIFKFHGRTQLKNQTIQPKYKRSTMFVLDSLKKENTERAGAQTASVSCQVYSETDAHVGQMLVKHLPANKRELLTSAIAILLAILAAIYLD